jgi:hypothetical protein
MNKNQISARLALASIILFALAGCSDSLSRTYYTDHPRYVQEVEQVWGKPVDVSLLNDGIERRTYTIQSPYTDFIYRYFLIRDDMVVASGITDTGKANQPDVNREFTGFVASDLSKAFYKRYKTTVAHLDRTWGKPMLVKDTDDGLQFRVYEINAPYTDFKYRKFIVKDGIVVASRICPEQVFSDSSTQPGYRGIEITEISRRYYQNHPMSLAAVETVWGEPILAQKDENGLEKRTYKFQMPTDTAFEFRFFVIEDGMVVASGISDTMDVIAK